MDYSCSVALTILALWLLEPFVLGGEVVSRQVCSDKCGNVSIPYPFGIEEGCYLVDPTNEYRISCNHSHSPPKPTIGRNVEVLNISVLEGELTIKGGIAFHCYNQLGHSTAKGLSRIYSGRFTVSSTRNKFVAIGCDTVVWFYGYRGGRPYASGCMTQCIDLRDVVNDNCNGIGCCETAFPDGISNITTTVKSYSNHTGVPFNPCSLAFPVENDAFKFSKTNLTHNLHFYRKNHIKVPVVLNWAVGRNNCSVAKANRSCMCKDNTECYEVEHLLGHRCKCLDGYSGNPYLPSPQDGCTDIDECKKPNTCDKREYCINTRGSYQCQCPRGYHGNGTMTDPCTSYSKKKWPTEVLIGAGVGGGNIAFLVIGILLYRKNGKRKLRKMRESFFRQNGGLLLHDKLSGRDDGMLKIFTVQELQIATDNYSDTNVIGRGGFGIVYKGTLPNNQLVAIKKSLKVGPNQVEQFVNEVLVLSKINNRNVVKLIGCCLEVEVPLLVYEFISNGTLFDHLHKAVAPSSLSWHMRLKIASEVADVLTYLHNTISPRIIHRDMKSMNILLDESYTAKVTDFGASRLVPLDQEQLATMVLGTWGYLDPEYMQTGDLTEKSDVYSFGVMLVELLTKKQAVSFSRTEIERNLSTHFLLNMKEGRLLDILDNNIVNEGTIEQMQQVADLAKGCLMLKGEDRPTMKEVAIKLETIKRRGSHPWIDNEKSFHDDCEALLGGNSRSGTSGWSSGIDSELYDVLSSLGSGR